MPNSLNRFGMSDGSFCPIGSSALLTHQYLNNMRTITGKPRPSLETAPKCQPPYPGVFSQIFY